jgi:hypothetical protein
MSAEFFARASCKDQPSSIWFPDNGEDYTVARAVCGACAVRPECLDYALTNRMEYGMWGALSPKERHLQRRRDAARKRKDVATSRPSVILDPLPTYMVNNGNPAQHGTRSMYARGCGCDDCREVERVYQSARVRGPKVSA